MGSNLNFKNMPPDGKANCSLSAANSRLGNFPLARQSSVYSLTFDEFQNTIGGLGKDFGSMNMDEFLKNIWTAEETQAMAAAFGTTGGANSSNPSSNYGLQRQGSLTLPRTLSQKTVDEVWRDIFRENSKDGSDIVGLNLPQRQQTLGEMTLEEFLVRAGVVREDTQSAVPANNSRFYGDYGGNLVGKSSEQTHSSNNGFALGFMQSGQSNGILLNTTQRGGLEIANQFAINPDRVRSSQQQQQQQQQQQASWLNNGYGVPVGQPQKQQQHQLFPKQPTMGYGSSMQLTNNAELTSLGIGGGLTLSQVGGGAGNVGNAVGIMSIGDSTVGIGTASPVGNGLVQSCLQGGTGMGVGSLGATGITVTVGSPVNQLSSDGLGKNNGDSSSLSPVPYMFNVGLRGRKCSGTVEKVVERRQRRMIKNRESAARSRARKQAYTMELEAEVAKLKEENTDLQRKQAEIMEMQKNQIFLNMVNTQFQKNIKIIRSDSGGEYLSSSLQDFFRDSGIIHQRTRSYTPQQKGVAKRKNRHVVETTHTMLIDAQDLEMIQQLGPKRQCLRRTRTGPW